MFSWTVDRLPIRNSDSIPIRFAALWCRICLVTLLLCCGEGGQAGRPPSAPAGQPGGDHVTLPAPAIPALDQEPRVDLLHNQHRWHLHGPGAPAAEGSVTPRRAAAGTVNHLVVPIAAEGLRKYSGEYKNPWGEVLEVEGHSGRVLGARQAVLRVPVDRAFAPMFRLRVLGAASGQQVSVAINGQRAQAIDIEPGWQVVNVPASNARLDAGHSEIRLEVKRRGKAGGVATYALWHSIEILDAADGDAADAADAADAGDAAWPRLTPAGVVRAGGTAAEARPALTGFARMRMLVEIPERAWLRLDTASPDGPAQFTVRITPIAGASQVLLDYHQGHHQGHQPDFWTRHHISLAELAGQLVELELATLGKGAAGAGWGEPRIVLESADIAPYQPARNIILFVVDTLRADRLSLYGQTRVRTRHISDAAGQGSAVFLHNQAASPSSPPSHASIQTGTSPRVHGISGDQAALRDGTPMLSAILAGAGFATGYVGNNNFAMGRLRQPGRWDRFYEPVFNRQGVDCVPVIEAMLRFVDERGDRRFFLSGLPLEPHVPYRYHQGITDLYFPGPYDPPIGKQPGSALISRITSGGLRMDDTRWKQIKALYDGEVHYVDECFGTLLRGLDTRGKLADTAIVLTSDHGEGMYEHGRMGHAYGHYGELANVPLVVLWPRGHGLAGASRQLDLVTGHIDIAPTVLEIVGLTPDPHMQGRGLLSVIRRQGAPLPRVVAMEYGRSYALRAREWRYIVDYSGREELYHVAEDPTEQRDVKADRPLALRYMRELAGFYLAHRTRWRATSWGDLNDHGPGFAITDPAPP
jgi:arylsulfatase A-like enzyme